MQTGVEDSGFGACFFPLYIITWLILAGITVLYLGGAKPAAKKAWTPWIALFNLVVIGGFLVAFALKVGRWQAVLTIVLALLFFGYFGIFKTRVCERCGKTTQPENLVKAARFCPRCGAELSPTRLRWPGPDSKYE